MYKHHNLTGTRMLPNNNKQEIWQLFTERQDTVSLFNFIKFIDEHHFNTLVPQCNSTYAY